MFTARLLADLKVEAWDYEYLIAYNKDVLANARRVLLVRNLREYKVQK